MKDNLGRVYDPRAVRQITQQWIDLHMKERFAKCIKSCSYLYLFFSFQ